MHIFIILVILAGLVLSFRYKGILHKVIACGLALPIILEFLGITEIHGIILSVLNLTMIVLTIVYGFKELKHSKIKHISVICFGFVLLLAFVFKTMNFPGAGYINLIIVLSFVFYLVGLIADRKHITKEISFMIIWLGYILS